jgi:hypothetical protein
MGVQLAIDVDVSVAGANSPQQQKQARFVAELNRESPLGRSWLDHQTTLSRIS